MRILAKMIFKRPPIQRLIEDSLYEARRLALENASYAEYYTAQASLYRDRVVRLEVALRESTQGATLCQQDTISPPGLVVVGI